MRSLWIRSALLLTLLLGAGIWFYAVRTGAKRDSAPLISAEGSNPVARVRPQLLPGTSGATKVLPRLSRLEVAGAEEGPDQEQLIARLLDESLPLKERRKAGRALAKMNSKTAMAALQTVLDKGPSYLKAAIAEGLGENLNPEAKGI